MEENISQENTNKMKAALDTILKNKSYILYFSITGLTLLIIIIWTISLFIGNINSSNQQIAPTPTITTNEIVQNPIEIQAIKSQTKKQIDPLVNNTEYTTSKVKMYPDNWSLIKIKTPDGNSAIVIAKKENNTWKVVMGPGSYFDKDDLDKIGAPQSIKDEINDSF